MQIVKNCVVTLNYNVTDVDGEMIDAGAEPLHYLHGGYAGIFQKVEDELDGKRAGDAVRITLQPLDAFGDYDADLVKIEPRGSFPPDVQIGMRFEGRADVGSNTNTLLFRVTDLEPDRVVLDANHQLAGMAMVFACEVLAVRAATGEEVQRGAASL